MKLLFDTHNRHNIAAPHFQIILPEVRLQIVRGRARHKIRKVCHSAFLIGSGPDCDLVLGDPQFADVHSCLLVTPRGVAIRHLGFEPILTVNGMPANKMELRHNNRIRTGPYEFRIHISWKQAPHLRLFVGSEDSPTAGGGLKISAGTLPAAAVPLPWRHMSHVKT